MDAQQLPNDIDQLKALLLEKQSLLQEQQQRIKLLEDYIRLQKQKRFGPSSEAAPGQGELFDEAEQLLEEEQQQASSAEVPCAPASTPKKKAGRKPLSKDLPRIDIIHDLSDEEKHCQCGTELKPIGEQVSEQLDIVPMKIQVLRHIRKKYACPCCEQGVITAALPPQPIPKSHASPGLLAHVAVSKYADALPLYRQSTILERFDGQITRTTLANWMIQAGQLIQPLFNLLQDNLLDGQYVHCDETTVQVLKEPNKSAQSHSYMWVRVSGDADKRIILYHYADSRSAKVAQSLLKDFSGYLQSDGYSGYNSVGDTEQVTAIGCWAHARRKFIEAEQSQPNQVKNANKMNKTKMALNYIAKLYAIEQKIKDLPPDKRTEHRQLYSDPILDELKRWLEKTKSKVPPQTLLGKALTYLDNQWGKLIVYTQDGRLAIDNNIAENAIRPFVVGRKNWLFANSQRGATASANLYSLIETAKANGLEPYAYVKRVFTDLPKATTVEQIEKLLPWEINKS